MLDVNKRRMKHPLLTRLSTTEVMGDLEKSCFGRVGEGH